MEFRPGVLWEYRVFLLQGLVTTAWLAVAAQALALALAVPTAVARLRGDAVTRRVAGAYVEFVRGTPALTQLRVAVTIDALRDDTATATTVVDLVAKALEPERSTVAR